MLWTNESQIDSVHCQNGIVIIILEFDMNLNVDLNVNALVSNVGIDYKFYQRKQSKIEVLLESVF